MRRDRALLLSAIRAELAALHWEVYEAKQNSDKYGAMHRMLVQHHRPDNTRAVLMPSFDAPIFKANIGNLGLLGTSLGADVIRVLSRADGKVKTAPPTEKPMPNDMVAMLYEAYSASLEQWRANLHHVAMRILATENGTPDPGTLNERDMKQA